MFRLRSASGVTAVVAILLAVIVVSALLFSGVVHAIVPHSHDGGEAIWQELHAFVRQAEKFLALLLLPASVLLARSVHTRVFHPACHIDVPLSSLDRLLHKGVAQYRRFG